MVAEKLRRNETRQLLSRGAELFAQGDYRGSLRENQRVLEIARGEPPADEALFSLGLFYAHVGNPDKDYGKAVEFFSKVTRDFPRSPLAEQAKVWVGVLRENDRLSQENQKWKQVIEKSKQVDIEIEQKKRERER